MTTENQAPDPAERKAAEQAYATTAFNYPEAPIGSRDWCLFWDGWRFRAAMGAIPAPEGAQADRKRFETYFAESRRSRGPSKRPTFEQFEDGTYKDDHTQRHWWTWQQARAALAAPAPQAPVALTDFQIYAIWEQACVDSDVCNEVVRLKSAVPVVRAILNAASRIPAPQTKEPTNDR